MSAAEQGQYHFASKGGDTDSPLSPRKLVGNSQEQFGAIDSAAEYTLSTSMTSEDALTAHLSTTVLFKVKLAYVPNHGTEAIGDLL